MEIQQDKKIMGAAIKINNATVTYRLSKDKVDTLKEYMIKKLKKQLGYKQFNAINNINLTIYKGEKIGIIGKNGAGKSTLLKLIAGVMQPTSGKVTVRACVAPLLELGAGFDNECTGRENIYLNSAILGKNKQFIDRKIDNIIDFSDLGNFIDEPVKTYSSGMRARLGFSIATQVNAQILILDEILGVGDEQFRKKSSRKMQNMIQQGNTVIIASHNLKQLEELTERVIWLEKGKIRKIGPSKQVCRAYRQANNPKQKTRQRMKQTQEERTSELINSSRSARS